MLSIPISCPKIDPTSVSLAASKQTFSPCSIMQFHFRISLVRNKTWMKKKHTKKNMISTFCEIYSLSTKSDSSSYGGVLVSKPYVKILFCRFLALRTYLCVDLENRNVCLRIIVCLLFLLTLLSSISACAWTQAEIRATK